MLRPGNMELQDIRGNDADIEDTYDSWSRREVPSESPTFLGSWFQIRPPILVERDAV